MPNSRVLASILTDIFNFVTESVTESVTQSVTESDVELCTWPEARGTAKYCLVLKKTSKNCHSVQCEGVKILSQKYELLGV